MSLAAPLPTLEQYGNRTFSWALQHRKSGRVDYVSLYETPSRAKRSAPQIEQLLILVSPPSKQTDNVETIARMGIVPP